jgi:hypothetical protein
MSQSEMREEFSLRRTNWSRNLPRLLKIPTAMMPNDESQHASDVFADP